MNKLTSFMILGVTFYMPVFAYAGDEKCKPLMGDVELYSKLASDPYFSNGVPPPGKFMRIEREKCNYRIYVGDKYPDALNGDIIIVDGDGKVVDIIRTY